MRKEIVPRLYDYLVERYGKKQAEQDYIRLDENDPKVIEDYKYQKYRLYLTKIIGLGIEDLMDTEVMPYKDFLKTLDN